MEFKLPFPTLKSLSSLGICLHWAHHKLGPFQKFPITHKWSEMIERRERHSHLSIDGLPIYHSLKAVVGDVLFGILKQRIYACPDLAKEVQFPHFDAFGRFDVKRTFGPAFRKKVADVEDLFFLHRLLTEAYDFWLLPEVDAIFRKMVAIMTSNGSRRQSEILMEGPRSELRHGKCHLVYCFIPEDAAQFLKTIRYPEYLVPIVLERESSNGKVLERIVIAPFPATSRKFWNFDTFKDHFDLFEPSSDREAFIEDVLSHRNLYEIDIKNLLDIFTFLKQKNEQRNWMLELRHCHFWWFFQRLLKWPFTSFFIVAFKHLAPHLEFNDDRLIFGHIVGAIHSEQQYGVLHRKLLMDYWAVLTVDEKRNYATSDYVMDQAMKELKVKAPFLHDAIKTELDSLVTATDERQSPKRMRLG